MAPEQKRWQECIELKVPSRFSYIPSIQAFIEQLVQQIGFCQTRLQDIKLITDEICSNAIEHGSETAASGIELICTLDTSRLEILVRDKGKRGQGDWLTGGRLDEVTRDRAPHHERGHGIYIVRRLSDYLEIHPNSQGGTDVRVVFHRSPSTPS
ncbi:MAG: ATP-binding protein [Candidatus Poribacteria bacterium]|nr:ATP-binding protein [Candidatus Poribacteria bacterium]